MSKGVNIGSVLYIEGIGDCRISAMTESEGHTKGMELDVLREAEYEQTAFHSRAKILDALETIAECCKGEECCKDCPLYSMNNDCCIFAKTTPEDMRITSADDVWRAVK